MLRVNSLSASFARSFGILLTTCLLTMAVLVDLPALALGPGLERFLLGRPSVWHSHLKYFCGSFRSTSAVLHEHLQEVLADLIADDVRKDLQGRRKKAAQIPPDILVQHPASTFIQGLNWWMESRSPLPAKEVNDLFRALILPTLAATRE